MGKKILDVFIHHLISTVHIFPSKVFFHDMKPFTWGWECSSSKVNYSFRHQNVYLDIEMRIFLKNSISHQVCVIWKSFFKYDLLSQITARTTVTQILNCNKPNNLALDWVVLRSDSNMYKVFKHRKEFYALKRLMKMPQSAILPVNVSSIRFDFAFYIYCLMPHTKSKMSNECYAKFEVFIDSCKASRFNEEILMIINNKRIDINNNQLIV